MNLQKIYPGVYEFSFGEREQFEPSAFAAVPPRADKLQALPDAPLPLAEGDILGEISARGALLRLPYEYSEELYGFGLQSGCVNQAGRKRMLKINADAQGDIGNSHAAIPFYVSTKGYGVVLDTLRESCFCCASSRPHDKRQAALADDGGIKSSEAELYAAKTYDGVVTAEVVGVRGLHGYLFAGVDAADVCRRYVLFSGGGAMPPLWGLGVWYRACGSFNAQEALNMAKQLRDEEMPITVYGLEPGWHSHAYSCSYQFDEKRYPNPQETLDALRDMGYRVNLWEHLFVHPTSPIYDALEPYSADYEVWGGLIPDFSLPKAREIFGGWHDEYLLAKGVSGFKCDECDNSDYTEGWSYPSHTKFPSGMDGEQMHNLLPMLYQQVLQDIYRKRDTRTWGEVRAQQNYAAPYPFLLYSDWYQHADYISMVLNMGFSGILYSPEIRTAESRADLYRRMLTGVFSPKLEMNIWFMPHPMWENYDRDDNWKHLKREDSDVLRAQCREFMRLRAALVPYLYTAFHRYYEEGIAPVRSLRMDYPECRDLAQNECDGLSFGDTIIVYPLTAQQEEATFTLPKGEWYCFFTHETFKGGREYTRRYPMEQIPVFVRAGTVLPLLENIEALQNGDTLQIRPTAFGAQASGTLYLDDFTSFAFEQGAYRIDRLTVRDGVLQTETDGNAQAQRVEYLAVKQIG